MVDSYHDIMYCIISYCVCVYRGFCLAFYFLLCIRWRRLVYEGLCVCVRLVGCCASSNWWVGWVSRFGLMGVVENARLGDRNLPIFNGFSGGERFLILLGD